MFIYDSMHACKRICVKRFRASTSFFNLVGSPRSCQLAGSLASSRKGVGGFKICCKAQVCT